MSKNFRSSTTDDGLSKLTTESNNDTSNSSVNDGLPSLSRSLFSAARQRWQKLFDWQPPLWSVATVTAVLIVSISINLQFAASTTSKIDIVAYQDNPVMTYIVQNDDTPGIGFFSNISSSSTPFNGVKISTSGDNHLTINWPVVDKAQEYTMRLYKITPENRSLVVEQKVSKNTATFANLPLQLLSANSRFEWSLTGVTNDNKSFQAQGGFVVRNNQ